MAAHTNNMQATRAKNHVEKKTIGWTLLFLTCATLVSPIKGKTNLALKKPNVQMSTKVGNYAGKAVDGKTGDNINIAGCAQSLETTEEQTWWIVDLGGTFIVDSVCIYSRSGACCSKRLREIQVQLIHEDGETIEVCKTIIPYVPNGGETYQCDKPVTGRFVRVIKIKAIERPLTICEIQVFGHQKAEKTSKRENFALMKPVRHSSIYSKSPDEDSTLVDGVYFQTGYDKTCFIWQGDTKVQWVIIDLQKTVLVDTIKLTPSYEWYDRFNFNTRISFEFYDFSIGVTLDDPEALQEFPNKMKYSFVCSNVTTIEKSGLPFAVKCLKPMLGRYVWIVRKQSILSRLLTAASLCEVEVYGNSSSDQKSSSSVLDSSVVIFTHVENIAWKKPTAQKSTKGRNHAQRAVDGMTNGNINLIKEFAGCSQSLEYVKDQSWWIVDLEGTYTIDSVRIYSRSDWNTKLLREIDIQIIHEDGETVALCKRILPFIPAGGKTFPCDKTVSGRFVRVMQINSVSHPLTLCEVQVFGVKKAEHGVEGKTNLAFMKQVSHSEMDEMSVYNSPTLVDGLYYTIGYLTIDSRSYTGEPDFCFILKGGTHVQWVVIDLEKFAYVDTIRVTPAFPASFMKLFELNDFSMGVSMENPQLLPRFPDVLDSSSICKNVSKVITDGLPFPVKCTQPIIGRYVWLVRTSVDSTLNLESASICEIEVFGNWRQEHESKSDSKEKTWRFKLIGVKGDTSLLNRQTSQALQTNCARKRLENKTDMYSAPYVLTDHTTGDCHFYRNIDEASLSSVEHYVVFLLE